MPAGANLSKADIDAVLSGADLRKANLSNTSLSSSHLENADLSYANMSGADLSFTNLRKTNLSGVNLQKIVYNEDTEWQGAIYNKETKFPEGFNPTGKGMHLQSLD